MPAIPDVVKPISISSISVRYGPGGNLSSGIAFSSFTWTANLAIYVPISIPWDYPVNRVWWANGSTNTSTNVDMGIYTVGGQRIYSTGSTAMGTVSVIQYVTPTVPFVLPAGQYYIGWTCSNTTSRATALSTSANVLRMAGCVSQSSALPLPATATFATNTATGLPIFGITRLNSGF